jgi:excisionase family DNA binding protein
MTTSCPERSLVACVEEATRLLTITQAKLSELRDEITAAPTTTVPDREKPAQQLLYDVEDARRLLGKSRSDIYELIARGEIESVKDGRRRKFAHDALTAYVERLRSTARA